jgi:hypothetical protein
MDPGTLDFDSSGSGRSVDGVSDEDLAPGPLLLIKSASRIPETELIGISCHIGESGTYVERILTVKAINCVFYRGKKDS